MKSNADDPRTLMLEVADFLRWQKHLGHPGVPEELISQRLKQRREKMRRVETPKAQKEERREVAVKEKPKAAVSIDPETFQSDLFAGGRESRTLEQVRENLGDCKRCKLWESRQNIVFGEGDPNADIMFIGEGPGADEDDQGRPFVGRAGKLLTKWIELGMGLDRSQVYIGNIVKCRPPKNRDPERDEVDACIGFIIDQVHAINPKVIVLLGRVPMMHLLKVREGITKVHGTWYSFEGIPTMPAFHPSYCLRPPQDEKKRLVWGDIKKILKYLKMPIPGKKK